MRSGSAYHRILALCVFLGLLFYLVQATLSAGLRGTLTSDIYSWSEGDQDHLRPYLALRANMLAWNSGNLRKITFHTYWRWTTDFQDKLASDPQFFIYDTYFRLKGVPDKTAIYAGRQFVYSAVGSAHMDGVRFRLGPVGRIQFDVFGGSQVSRLDPERIRSFSDFGVLGGQTLFQIRKNTRIGLGWIRRQYKGFVSYHRLGINVRQVLGKSRLYARFSANPEIWRPSEAVVRIVYSPSEWSFSGEYVWRDPSVSYNSIFSLIDFKRYREVRFEAQRNILQNLAIFGHLRTDFFSTENSWSARFGVRARVFTIAWVHQSGYGGDSDGLSGYVNYRINKSWYLYGRMNVSQYRVQEKQDNRSEAYSTGVGLLKHFASDIQVRGEWQYMRNAVQSYDSRFQLRISKGFSLR